MPTFNTPSPITADIQVVHGDIRIEASDRPDTTVEVTPTNPHSQADLAAVEQSSVEFADGVLRVKGAKGRGIGLIKKPGSVQVTIQIPSTSTVDAATGCGRVRTSGALGTCHIRSGAGDLELGDAGSVDLVTGLGAISAAHVSGNAVCKTGSGSVRLATVDGSAQVRNSNGDTWLGDVRAAVNVKASNGTITIERAAADAKVATANGDVTIGSATRGNVDVRTALGRINVGVAQGTAARLDLHTSFGSVVTDLDATGRPTAGETTVEITAHTSAGDIVVSRA